MQLAYSLAYERRRGHNMVGWSEYVCCNVISLTKNMGFCSYISTSPMPLMACTPTYSMLFHVLDQR
jgi:hypothetical protein